MEAELLKSRAGEENQKLKDLDVLTHENNMLKAELGQHKLLLMKNSSDLKETENLLKMYKDANDQKVGILSA